MKRNIYSKLWMIFFVLMGAACTNQVEDAIPVSGQPIEFSVQSDWKEIPNTRSNDKTQFGPNDEIQIFGFHKPSKDAVENVPFMYQVGDSTTGQKVKFDGTNWYYSPKRFWPKKGLLDFYASYPCNPYNSIHHDVEKKRMTYENNLMQDLLYGLATDWNREKNPTVSIWMVHALAKVKISFNGFSDEIGSVIVSAYKTGRFSGTLDGGIPDWQVDDKTNIDAVFYKYGDKNLIINNSVTVFILPGKITGFQMFDVPGNRINASDEIFDKIQNLTFKAGKEYNLTISKGVQKKNTNSRSIAMSVRCVSE
jgi:hypothetical protein